MKNKLLELLPEYYSELEETSNEDIDQDSKCEIEDFCDWLNERLEMAVPSLYDYLMEKLIAVNKEKKML